jgi:hypothetical protein
VWKGMIGLRPNCYRKSGAFPKSQFMLTGWRHQKEALGYMMQRESGPVPSEFCLWKPVEDDGVGGW